MSTTGSRLATRDPPTPSAGMWMWGFSRYTTKGRDSLLISRRPHLHGENEGVSSVSQCPVDPASVPRPLSDD